MTNTSSTYSGTYSDNWNTFIRTIGKLSPAQKRHVRAEAATAGTLSIILSGQSRHRHPAAADLDAGADVAQLEAEPLPRT